MREKELAAIPIIGGKPCRPGYRCHSLLRERMFSIFFYLPFELLAKQEPDSLGVIEEGINTT